jgi:hypothetical protein
VFPPHRNPKVYSGLESKSRKSHWRTLSASVFWSAFFVHRFPVRSLVVSRSGAGA